MTTATAPARHPLAALRTPLQKVGAVLVVLGFLVLVTAVVTGNQAQQRVWEGLPDCGAAQTADCVQVRDGRFVVREQKDEKVLYFHAEGESGRDEVSVDERHLRGSKSTAQALYLGDDVIGIQDRDGERHWRSGVLDVPAWYLLGFGAGFLLVLGGITAIARPTGKS